MWKDKLFLFRISKKKVSMNDFLTFKMQFPHNCEYNSQKQ